ncbi:SRPBCC family protein [Saccharopolyspora cebuensis]|uniref:SRPBCC family protein n=1 Tax=Saccharopolyspora cebuensis TaxID=418759 RepID=A0ABV4CK64_9PSEU
MHAPDTGTLGDAPDGRRALTFERSFAHPPEKVWRALTEPEHLRGWFAQYLDYERSRLDLRGEGAELEFVPAPGPEQPPVEKGRVVRSAPPGLLEYTWGAETLRWELAPDGDGGCLLTFTNLFPDPSFAPFNALGWHSGLDRLTALLDGDDPAAIRLEADEAAAGALLHHYEEAFG